MNDQERFWKGEEGDAYAERNIGNVASNTAFFARALARSGEIESVLELGAGIGENIEALHNLLPDAEFWSVEINRNAAERINYGNVIVASLLSFKLPSECKPDLVITKGVLIHVNPSDLQTAYLRLYECSKRYILIAEYFNPTPVSVEYRGQAERLWKRDFAAEMMNEYPLRLVDYGFVWKHDPMWNQDNLNWWLLSK